MGRFKVARKLGSVFKDKQALLAQEASPGEMHFRHVTGNDMLMGTAEGTQATLVHLDDVKVVAKVLELRVNDPYLSARFLLLPGCTHGVLLIGPP